MRAGKIDQRREAGVRTRTRLMDAALDLLARRGEDAVTLREVTDAAGANVSGSIGREGLVRVSINGAYANGQLSGNTGSGKWNGASAGIPCSGRWQASRQG